MIARTVALVVIGAVGQEPAAIRNTLEYFGFQVIYYPIGRPRDFIMVLNGNALYDNISDVIICAHGEGGAFIMPELEENSYETLEPRGKFTAEHIKIFGNLSEKTVITTACGMGNEKMGAAFLKTGCKYFIGASDYVDGNAALLFVQYFYYNIAKGDTSKKAYSIACKIDAQQIYLNYLIINQLYE